MVKSSLIAIIALSCLLSGCICTTNPLSKGSGGGNGTSTGAGSGLGGLLGGGKDSSGGLGGLLGGDDSGTSDVCRVPPEVAALKLGDCDKMKNPLEKASCVTAIALRDRNPDTCNRLKDELMEACVAIIAECKKDVTLCDRLGGRDMGVQYACIAGVAKARADVALCDTIDNPAYKNPCIAGVAAARKDVSLCDRLSDKSDKDECVTDVAVALRDASVCDKLDASFDYWKRECIQKVAMVKGDMALCAKTSKETKGMEPLLEACVKNVSASKPDATHCGEITHVDIRDFDCYITIALATDDLSLCDKVSDDTRKTSCMSHIAAARKDVSICDKVPFYPKRVGGDDYLNKCITEVVKATKNKAPCEKITNKYAKQDCLKA